MFFSSKNPLHVALLGGLVGAVFAVFVCALVLPSLMTKSSSLSIPVTDFNATERIPGTTVSVMYPKEGFHGLGAKVTVTPSEQQDSLNGEGGFVVSRGVLGRLQLEPTVAYSRESGLGALGMTVDAQSKVGNETLNQIVDRLKADTKRVTHPYIVQGYRLPVNGREWFIYKVTEDHTSWTAVSVGTTEIVRVVLWGTPSDSVESKLAFGFGPETLRSILQGLRFE